ncbi:hypothetical protein AMATHDRAFT_53164 [Amanita thiersii Skay4041]|uniref:Chromo domain-containing protein n=1 Tax=Amanita thiersii Skay4041 TaxID=703135 RepID=A0A2A9NUQ9_9AGAR|nr:hypothetical protein AMATHDRAFT_53164 [Amanita thiersii Skay4041]
MSDQDESEYEVENVVQARIEKLRGKKLIMKFRVRWKGYTEDDDTWEPIESFSGSEHFIDKFWQRASTGGRDYRDIGQFKLGEVFVPMGPPRRKRKRDSNVHEPPESISTATNPDSQLGNENGRSFDQAQRRNDSPCESPARSLKRMRGRRSNKSSRSSSKDQRRDASDNDVLNDISETPRRPVQTTSSPPARRSRRSSRRAIMSPESIPPSDDESDGPDGSLFGSPSQPLQATLDDAPTTPSLIDVDEMQNASTEENVTLQKPPVSPSPMKVPSYRQRSAKPLIKMVDDPNMMAMDNAISVKARLMGRPTSTAAQSGVSPSKPPAVPKIRPGPGRSSAGLKKNTSSLLTFEKGALKTVKGRYISREKETEQSPSRLGRPAQGDTNNSTENARNMSPPAPRELLALAGLEKETEDLLPSYEDSIELVHNELADISSDMPREKEYDARKHSRNEAKDKLFPESPSMDIPTYTTTAWKRSTIFDNPLLRGSDVEEKEPDNLQSEMSHLVSFHLTLDASISIPVKISSTTPLFSDSLAGKMGVPGKFYRGDSATSLIDALRTGGPSGIVVIDIAANVEHKKHWVHFCDRLASGDLFIAMAGINILALCSSENPITQRLNIPTTLMTKGNILVSQVTIQNYTVYAELAAHSDQTRWLEYVSQK